MVVFKKLSGAASVLPVVNPRLRLTSVTIGTARPRLVAAFYARLLGTTVATEEGPGPGEPVDAGWAQLRAPDGPTVNVEYERHFTRPTWPSAPGSQSASQHLDIEVSDLSDAVEHAVACGATVAEVQPQDGVRVLFDPDGHPFCLFQG